MLITKNFRSIYWGLLCILFSGCSTDSQEQNVTVLTGTTMGTTYMVKISDKLQQTREKQIHTELNAMLDNINRAMSTYIPDSEISIINQSRHGDWISVSDDLAKVLQESLRISNLTDGAFDITIGPLVNLWGFGPNKDTAQIPDTNEIETGLNQIGYEKIDFQTDTKQIRKLHPNLYLDLSAIAKGYAVDQLAEYLEVLGFADYLVEIGGEVRAKGNNPNHEPWNIGIEKPVTSQRVVHKIIALNDISMATSGDYRNYFVSDGIRYSHTINPVTGRPVEHKLASITVLHQSAMTADALATALTVLGPEHGLELATQQGLAVLFIIGDKDGFTEKSTAAFMNYTVH